MNPLYSLEADLSKKKKKKKFLAKKRSKAEVLYSADDRIRPNNRFYLYDPMPGPDIFG